MHVESDVHRYDIANHLTAWRAAWRRKRRRQRRPRRRRRRRSSSSLL